MGRGPEKLKVPSRLGYYALQSASSASERRKPGCRPVVDGRTERRNVIWRKLKHRALSQMPVILIKDRTWERTQAQLCLTLEQADKGGIFPCQRTHLPSPIIAPTKPTPSRSTTARFGQWIYGKLRMARTTSGS